MNVEIRTTEPQTVAFIRVHDSYTHIPQAIKEVYVWAATHLLIPAGGPNVVYYTMPVDGDDSDVEWEVYVPLGRDAKLRDADKRGHGVRRTEAVQVAVAVHTGPYETLAETHTALQDWVAENGYTVAGPSEESYLNDPTKVAPEEILTEVRFPIAKA